MISDKNNNLNNNLNEDREFVITLKSGIYIGIKIDDILFIEVKGKNCEVAEKLKLTKPAISALVKRLTRNELIEKSKSNEDERIYYLKVTEKGIKIIEGDNDLYSQFTSLISEIISEDQLKELDCLLYEVVKILNNKE